MSNKQEPSAGDHRDAVTNLRKQSEIEKQRKVINAAHAEIRRKTINKSLQTFTKLVEKKTCGTK